jgi:hypothetical protein
MQFRTFRDRDSVNHAALSVRFILREKMLQSVPAAIRRLVLGAVFLHNTRELPPRLNPALRLVAEAVRDSDKLDIMRIMIEHFAPNRSKHPEVSLEAKEHPTNYSEKVINAVLAREVSDYRNIVWVNDFKLLIIGWLYDLNTRASRRLLRETNRLEGIFALLPRDERIQALHEQIRRDLAEKQ